MNEMNITSAQYISADLYGTIENISIAAVINGTEVSVPIAEGNKEYDEIVRQVAEGTLTIADAD
jgi:hypothetical protein